LRKEDPGQVQFRVNAFLEKKEILLQGVDLPVYTVAKEKSLIKIQERESSEIPWYVIHRR